MQTLEEKVDSCLGANCRVRHLKRVNGAHVQATAHYCAHHTHADRVRNAEGDQIYLRAQWTDANSVQVVVDHAELREDKASGFLFRAACLNSSTECRRAVEKYLSTWYMCAVPSRPVSAL